LRGGVATNVGNDYEFFQANTLGGTTNLRGYRKDRFYGKTSIYDNTELRYKISNYSGYIFRGEYGVLTFFDNGRVWVPGENSNTWHCGYGGGFWALAYKRVPLTVTYGTSKESSLLNVKAGFLF
jgi:hemolysin activation/secretion protein